MYPPSALADQYQIVNKKVLMAQNIHTLYCLHLELTVSVFPGAEPVHVSRALQKAKIVVNEDGTKAAAATSKYLFRVPCLGLKC